jgi:hypothetical protein
MLKLGCVLPLPQDLDDFCPPPLPPGGKVRREGELGLLSLHGSYYLAISAPHAVKSQFSSQTGVGGVKQRKIHSKLVLKGQYLCKNESSAEKKTHIKKFRNRPYDKKVTK